MHEFQARASDVINTQVLQAITWV